MSFPPTADICDAYPNHAPITDLSFHDYGAIARFGGEVQTVRCFEDNSMVRTALEQPGEGRVLVVDGGGSMRVALFGDQLATLAIESDWAGILIEGCVRDAAALGSMPIGIRALGTCPQRSQKRGQGQIGAMVRIGRMDIRSGWWLYADEDGIVVLPHQVDLDTVASS